MKMKKMLFIMACAVITGMGMQSCRSNDAKVQNEVENVLRSNYSNVSTTYREGVATLTGVVDTQQERTAAENAARSVKNVRSVVNNITVRQAQPTPASSVTVNRDETITSNINSRLRSEGFNDVRVSVSNGEVTLSGDLNRTDLNKVMQIANESSPRRVVNNINLR